MKHAKYSTLPGLLILASVLTAVTVLAAGESVPRSAISGGGGADLAAGDYVLHGALGQPLAGAVSNTAYRLCSGFWCGGLLESRESTIYLPLVLRNHWLDDAPGGPCPDGADISVGQPVQENFDRPGDGDWYKFNAIGGVTYTIETTAVPGSTADPYLSLFGTDCTQLVNSTSIPIVWRAPTSGTYFIFVGESQAGYGPDTWYTLTVREN